MLYVLVGVATGVLGLAGGFVLAKRASLWCPGCGRTSVPVTASRQAAPRAAR